MLDIVKALSTVFLVRVQVACVFGFLIFCSARPLLGHHALVVYLCLLNYPTLAYAVICSLHFLVDTQS